MNVPLTDAEFATVLADESKRIQGDVIWREDEDRSPAVEFRVDIESTNGWPLFVKGRYSVAARTLTYTLILKTAGRIYGLDLGKDHYNPQCEQVGEKHKHRWSERYGSGGRLDGVLCRSTHSARWQDEATAASTGGVVVMDASDACQDLQRRIGALFTCSEHGDYQRIRTPYLYPDGDNIDLFCKVDGDTLTVSDLAETTGWLRMQSAALRRSPKQTRLIEDACVTHGIEFYRGMLQARCRPGDEMAQVVTRVAQAALRVSDLWFTFRTPAVESTTDEVADFLSRSMTESKERIGSNAEERHDGGADMEQAQHQRQTASAFAFAILGRRLRAAVSGPERFRVDAFARNQLRTSEIPSFSHMNK